MTDPDLTKDDGSGPAPGGFGRVDGPEPTFPAGHPLQAYRPAPPTSGMAIGALVASIAGWTLLPVAGWIVGVILGHIALAQLRTGEEQGRGLAVAALVVGYVGIALALLGVALVAVFVGQFATYDWAT